MIKSNTQKDFDVIQMDDHVKKVISSITYNFNEYFKKISGASESGPYAEAKQKLFWQETVDNYINDYDKECKSYRNLFSEEELEETLENDDPKAFKKELTQKCPIIRKSIMSSMKELQEWKEAFAQSVPQELLETFLNFLDYARDYMDEIDSSAYEVYSKKEDFENLYEFSNDPDLSMQRVVGAGIKTSILYYLNAEYFNKSVRRNLYGLHFLTLDLHERMPSRTSEFTMIDDTKIYKEERGSKNNYTIEHNYWYPYNLFMFYSKLIYNSLKIKLKPLGINTQPKYRYVYVTMFLELIINEHKEAVRTMMGGDQEF